MLPVEVLPTFDGFDNEDWGILSHKEQTAEFISTPPRGVIQPVPIRPVPQYSWDSAENSSIEFEGKRRTPQSVMSDKNMKRVDRWVMGGGQWSCLGQDDGRRTCEMSPTFDDFDSEVWGIFGHEEQRVEFISIPPRGIIRPIPIRPVPQYSWNCAESQTKTSKSDEDVNRMESTGFEELHISEKVVTPSSNNIDKKPNKIRSLVDRLRTFVNRILG